MADGETQRHRGELTHQEKMFELGTERLKAAVDALRILKDLDPRVGARIAKRLEALLADIAELPEP
jgi:hypothetical protein